MIHAACNNCNAIHQRLVILSTGSFGVCSRSINWLCSPSSVDVVYILVTTFTSSLFVGNKKSLADAVDKGINLRDRILKLYHDNYYGGSMKLVIIGGGEFFLILS